MSVRESPRVAALRRRLLGLAWVALWGGVLYLVAAPWWELGGIVSERLRWLHRFALGAGAISGFTLAGAARDLRSPETPRAYTRTMRWLLYPALALSATGLVALHAAGRSDPIGIVLSGLLAYWAGCDAALGALPLLMEGRLPTQPPTEPSRPDGDGERGSGPDVP